MNCPKLLIPIFGDKPSSSESDLIKAARLPQPVRWLVIGTRWALLFVLGMAGFGFKDRIPVISPWMAEAGWRLYAVWGPLIAISIVGQWVFEYRISRLKRLATLKDRQAA